MLRRESFRRKMKRKPVIRFLGQYMDAVKHVGNIDLQRVRLHGIFRSAVHGVDIAAENIPDLIEGVAVDQKILRPDMADDMRRVISP